MRYYSLLLLIAIGSLCSCKKQRTIIDNPPVTPPPVNIPPVLLKDVNVATLPPPYYHFEYDTDGKVTAVSFASGFNMYEVSYSNNRISEMKNNTMVNKDRLQYFYDLTGRVIAVHYIDMNGIFFKKSSFAYDGQKLVKIEWERNVSGNFIKDRTLSFSYQQDGNVLGITDHRLPVQGQNEIILIDRFEDYDNKINTDGFGLVHDETSDHLILLPGVQIQKNNARKQIRSGTGLHYNIINTYTYSEKNVPLTKNGLVTITNGQNAGQQFQSNTAFTYY